jgi:hypothetical protein
VTLWQWLAALGAAVVVAVGVMAGLVWWILFS